MSWASRRRTVYFLGVTLFIGLSIGGPVLLWYLSIPETCHDNIQNQSETSIDKGGPCLILDERYLQPYSVMWSRSLLLREGMYTAIAYIENPNPSAGTGPIRYRFRLLDNRNVIITERVGTAYIMPGGITPIIETGIGPLLRQVVHTRFDIIDPPPVWKHASNNAADLVIRNQKILDENTSPRVEARVTNLSLKTIRNSSFIAVVFDTAGNAHAASATALPEIGPQEVSSIVFSWPYPFSVPIGKIDIIPVLPPAENTDKGV